MEATEKKVPSAPPSGSPQQIQGAQTEEPSSGLRPFKRNSEKKYLSRSLRLNNNEMTDINDLPLIINQFLTEPSLLTWLDLSFNKITHIDRVLCELHELRVLYRHGSRIYILSEVYRLGVLPHLHTITLHGNIVEAHKAYRNQVIAALSHLKKMDFSAVTHEERALANIWHQNKNRSRGIKTTLD